MADIELRQVSKQFGDARVIDNVDFRAEHGEFVVFVGPSGCGKSTLLRLITGLESATSGQILIGGEDVTAVRPSRRGVAMVFQSYALFPHLTVAENIGFGLRLAKVPKPEIARRVGETARILRVEDLLDRKPRQLSGGQRQRVAIGRSIIRDPKVFLFDEPLSNLDAALRVLMRLEIARLHQRLEATMIYVTHDQTEAMTLANRIVVINLGRIEQVGSPMELYDSPANRFVAGFIGSPAMNFLDTSADDSGLRLGRARIQSEKWRPSILAPVSSLGIRPEHITVCPAENADLTAKVEIVEELGAEMLVYLQTDASASPITMRAPPSRKPEPGDRLPIRFDRSRIHLFDTGGCVIGNAAEN